MGDSAHDSQHIYRVLFIALDIAEHEKNVDKDILIAAGLMGIARSLLYEGKAGTPIYSLGSDFEVLDGTGNEPPSFLENITLN